MNEEDLKQRLYRALDALGGMYMQYTPGNYGHDFMSAGEEAQDVLGAEKLLDNDNNFIGMPAQAAAPDKEPFSWSCAHCGREYDDELGDCDASDCPAVMYPQNDWKREVQQGQTSMGYRDWVILQVDLEQTNDERGAA